MKAKTDFVTNSSSTNFIVADYRKNRKKLMVEYNWGKIDLLKAIPTRTYTSYSELECNVYSKNYEQFKEVFENGGIIYVLHARDSGAGAKTPLEAGFCSTGIEGGKVPRGVKILQGKGGY